MMDKIEKRFFYAFWSAVSFVAIIFILDVVFYAIDGDYWSAGQSVMVLVLCFSIAWASYEHGLRKGNDAMLASIQQELHNSRAKPEDG